MNREEVKQRIRDSIGGVPAMEGAYTDNLAIIIVSYFDEHLARPDDDEEDEERAGWGVWSLEKTDQLLDRITDEVMSIIPKEVLS